MKAKLENLKDLFLKNKKFAIGGGIGLAVVVVIAIMAVVFIVSGLLNKDNSKGEFGKGTYSVEIKTEGGLAFKEAGIYIYRDSALTDLVDFKKTDADGKITFDSSDAKGYYIVVKEIPEGYDLKASYPIKGKETKIVLKTVVTALEDMDTTKFELGSVIKDFSVTTPDGTKVTVTELLKEKKAVVLNFFYLGCMPCKDEFPHLEEAYKEMSADVAVLAMTPVDKDDAAIKEYYDSLGLSFYMAQCDEKFQNMFGIDAYPMTVVIDKYGVITFIHTGSINEPEQFKEVFGFFTADGYKQTLIKNIEDIAKYEAEEGTEFNPIGIIPDSKSIEAKVTAGKKVYYQIPNVKNKIITISDADAYIEYNGETYKPENGVLTMSVSAEDSYTPAVFAICNGGSSDKTFTVELSDVPGSIDNPYSMSLGDFKASVEAGNDQGVYYTYTADTEGYLSVICKKVTEGVDYDFTVYNHNTYVSRSLSNDGVDGVVKVGVHKGDVVQFYVMTLPDDKNQYPAAEFDLNVSHEPGVVTDDTSSGKDVTYTVSILDANGNGVPNVVVSIGEKELTTDTAGKVFAVLKGGSYEVSVTVPDGFVADNARPNVTEAFPDATVTLTSSAASTTDYTVKVTDESGNAIKNATVIAGNNVSVTNNSGIAIFTIAKANYTITAEADGYVSGSAEVTATKVSVTIVLKKGTSTNKNLKDYSVTVKDYSGSAISDVSVQFLSGTKVVKTVAKGTKGVYTAKLEAGNYTVKVVSDKYKAENLSLTSSKVSGTIKVAPIAKTPGGLYDAEKSYIVELGTTYASGMKTGDYTYFLFKPTKSGIYKFTTDRKDAKLSYWGGSTDYYYECTSSTDYTAAKNSFSVEVMDASIGGTTLVVAVKGSSECYLTIERTGNASKPDERRVYGENVTVKKFTYTGSNKNFTYFDIKSKSEYKLVIGSDGYYHKDSATGPIVYVNMNDRKYHSFTDRFGITDSDAGAGLFCYFYDNNGNVKYFEDYSALMKKYAENRDKDTDMYPLTPELKYMLEKANSHYKWGDSTSPNYLFYDGTTPIKGINKDLAWMYACCFIQ